MLVGICMSAEIMRAPDDPSDQRLYFSALLAFFQNLLGSCVVYVDPHNELTGRMHELIDVWPVRYRKRLKELMGKLRGQNRFFKTEARWTTATACLVDSCRRSTGVWAAGRPRPLVIHDVCVSCVALAMAGAGTEAIPLPDFQPSDLANECRLCRDHRLRSGEWSRGDFELRILRPLFRTAKHVRIFDRYVGRSLLSSDGVVNGLSARYTGSLEWIFGVFRQECAHRVGSVFEVHCGFEAAGQPRSTIDAVRQELRNWEARMVAASGFAVRVVVKSEKLGARFPHARYLLTDQTGVLIETGFELFLTGAEMLNLGLTPGRDQERIRDVTVSSGDSYRGIDVEVARLPDL